MQKAQTSLKFGDGSQEFQVRSLSFVLYQFKEYLSFVLKVIPKEFQDYFSKFLLNR